MTLSSKLCISLVALALTAGGAFAATTISGTKSNSSYKSSTPGTQTPATAGKASADFDKSNVTDNSTGCTKTGSGATDEDGSVSSYRKSQGSSTGGGGMMGSKAITVNASRSNSLRTAQQPCTSGGATPPK